VSADVDIQFVTLANAHVLDRVDDDVFDHAVQPAFVQTFLANPANLLVVALVDGDVIGMTSGVTYAHPDKPLQLFIVEVGVSSRFHRRGIARRLIEAMLERGKELGCREAWTATEVDNAPARALYGALGGKEDADLAVVYVYDLQEKAAVNDAS